MFKLASWKKCETLNWCSHCYACTDRYPLKVNWFAITACLWLCLRTLFWIHISFSRLSARLKLHLLRCSGCVCAIISKVSVLKYSSPYAIERITAVLTQGREGFSKTLVRNVAARSITSDLLKLYNVFQNGKMDQGVRAPGLSFCSQALVVRLVVDGTLCIVLEREVPVGNIP